MHDPAAETPPELDAHRLEEIAASDFVFVAVPIAKMRSVFEELRPHLGPASIVVDVGSVKLEPAQWMQEIFGEQTPWVASHPLFGPVSLSRAEVLRVVVCPNPAWPVAEAAVAELYRELGAAVIAMDPETHDRIMAQTHALAFYLAKGLLDLGVPTDSPVAPPSFQAMARTIEAVRGDAGHLLPSLHRENPFAAEYRSLLLEKLQGLDKNLAAAPQTEETRESVEIQPPSSPPDLLTTRDRIDELDREIVDLLARRAELSKRAWQAKLAEGKQVRDVERESALLGDRKDWATAAGLDPRASTSVFEAILQMSREIQERL